MSERGDSDEIRSETETKQISEPHQSTEEASPRSPRSPRQETKRKEESNPKQETKPKPVEKKEEPKTDTPRHEATDEKKYDDDTATNKVTLNDDEPEKDKADEEMSETGGIKVEDTDSNGLNENDLNVVDVNETLEESELSNTKDVEDNKDDDVKDRSVDNAHDNSPETSVKSPNVDNSTSEENLKSSSKAVEKLDESSHEISVVAKENKSDDTPVVSEQEEPKDEYVPLDQQWSSPKRQFSGVQGEYSFNSRRSYLQESLNKSREKDDEKKQDDSTAKVEPEIEKKADENNKVTEVIENKAADKEIIDEKDHVVCENNDTDDKDHVATKKNDMEEKDLDSVHSLTNDDTGENTFDSRNDRTLSNEKEETLEILPIHTTNKDEKENFETSKEEEDGEKFESTTKKQEADVVEDLEEKEATSETQAKDEFVIRETTKPEKEMLMSSPRRSRDRYDSDSSRSLSGSPRRSPPPTQMKWEKENGENGEEADKTDHYEDDGFESDNSEKDKKSKRDKNDSVKRDNSVEKNESNKNKQSSENDQRAISSPRQIMAVERRTKRPGAKSAVEPKSTYSKDSPRALSPAQAKSPRSHYIRYTPTQQAAKPKPRPKTTTGGRSIASEEGRTKQKEFFRAELQRLQRSLEKESVKISRPKQREYYPFVWTSLEPYYNTYVASYLIDMSEQEDLQHRSKSAKSAEDPRPGFVSRNTAIGLCDPWTDLKMDRDLLPRLETAARTKRRQQLESKESKKEKKGPKKPPKAGSTRLPKFPIVDFNTQKENATKCFPYYEVPKFREGMKGRYSLAAPKKVESDYIRTRQDFYRMDLDRLDEVHPINRPHMRKAYFAYLQNTPGSKKAIKECVKNLSEEDKANMQASTQQAQKAN